MAIPEASSELPNLKIEIENDLEETMEVDDNGITTENLKNRDEEQEEGELSDSKDTEAEAKLSAYGINMRLNEQNWVLYSKYIMYVQY